jgi:hypothetical protein
MTGRNDGGAGSVVGKIRRWAEVYEKVLGREEKLKKELRKIESLLKEAEKTNIIDTEKMRRQYQRRQEELRDIQERRLRLEWLATVNIRKGNWNPEGLAEYGFVQDLLLLNRIREEQVKEVCRNCKECQIIRVKTTDGEVPLEVAKPEKACSLPYIPYYSLKEIWQTKEQLQMNVKFLGPLTPEEKMELEKWVSERLALHRNLLNSIIEEKRVVIPSRKLLYRRCTRKLPKALPTVREKGIEEEAGDPKAVDHFPQDITAEIDEDGSYTRVYISAKHGDSESE